MRWDQAIPVWLDLLDADTALLAAVQAYQTAAGLPVATVLPVQPGRQGQTVEVPGWQWWNLGDHDEETWNPILVQIDLWAPTLGLMATLERHTRSALHSRYIRLVGGLRMETTLTDARTVHDPEPDLVHRQLDFRVAPLRGA